MPRDKINRNIEVTLMSKRLFCMLQNSSNSSPGQSDTGQSVEEFAESLGRLTIADDTFLSPDTISTASTQSDEPTPVILPEPREKLSEFLVACKLEPLGKPWLSWSDSSERTRQRQTRRDTDTPWLIFIDHSLAEALKFHISLTHEYE